MKKVISSVVLGTVMLSCLPAEAAEAPSLDFLKKSYKDSDFANMEQKGEVTFTLNEPISVLGEVDKYFEGSYISNVVNIKSLAEGLFDSKISVASKQLVGKDGKDISCEVNMKMGSPVVINPNLSLDVNTNYSVWADIDVSDDTKVVMDYIMAMPYSAKYITMNSEDLTYAEDIIGTAAEDTGDSVSEMLRKVFDDEKIKEINDKAVDSIYRNATVTGGKNKVKITFSDIGLKKYIADVLEIAFSLYDDEMLETLDIDYVMSELEAVAKSVPFFGKDAMVLEYELDGNQKIVNQTAEINVDLNLFDLVKAMGEDPYGMTKDNSRLCFTINGYTDVTYGNAKITRPKLTEENSISFTEFANPYPQDPDYLYEENEEYFNYYEYVDLDDKFDSHNGIKYVPLRNLLEEFNYDVSYDNGKITAVSDSKFAEYKTIEISIGSTAVKLGLNSINIAKSPVIIDDKAYITVEDSEKILNIGTDSYEYYPNQYNGYICFFRNANQEDFGTIN